MFEILFRGAMLFECVRTAGEVRLNRVLIPHAERDDDVRDHWRHKTKAARKHFSGALRERGVQTARRPLRSIESVTIGSGTEQPTIAPGVLNGLPDIRNVLAPNRVRLRQGGFVEVIPRGKASIVLAHSTESHRFLYPNQSLLHFSATLQHEGDIPPAHSIPGLDLRQGDHFAFYNHDHLNPSMRDLEDVEDMACGDVLPDDDFYWLYSMFEWADGSPLDIDQLPVPTIDCSGFVAGTRGVEKFDNVSVSTCFPGFW